MEKFSVIAAIEINRHTEFIGVHPIYHFNYELVSELHPNKTILQNYKRYANFTNAIRFGIFPSVEMHNFMSDTRIIKLNCTFECFGLFVPL